MRVEFKKTKGNWREVADAANTTINRVEGEKEPSDSWKRRMLLSEHSPIRKLSFNAKWYDLKYWVSVHLVRHKFGIEHWVRTQRTDRAGVDRDLLPQGSLVEHEVELNAQAMIQISRKRLCHQASKETKEAWVSLVEEVSKHAPEMKGVCVPDCIYRGWCYEYKSCGYHFTEAYQKDLDNYRSGINESLASK
ncbi:MULTISPECIES: thymidylate synthase ThyX [unclassified Fusibacter]|uniref:thymidylate synthase ThyX n=1 Tax=unclassified Fusibacter TaxID=2624464 RepID=UPI001013B710|nr:MULTISPECIES: thymidylate synthase ThyX [unclassified Fusibacter]MCK8061705.1 thymidylate synthase ThyX [Fusibacter sp. A2]NPE23885.1 thymidylate synthase ThyX [Fusibacter sp. A1]RXV58509.1 thymidylate synthase ThyX [Fusibacter sp. A1]